jgi:hypothetical protein
MPADVVIDRARRRVVARVYGEVTLDDIVGAIDASIQDPAFEPGFDVYSDHLGVEKVITSAQLKAMTRHLGSIASLGDRLPRSDLLWDDDENALGARVRGPDGGARVQGRGGGRGVARGSRGVNAAHRDRGPRCRGSETRRRATPGS